MNVFILASCPNPDLLPYTLLVFDTLRIGFPAATVNVTSNITHLEGREALARKCNDAGASLVSTDTIHHAWITKLLNSQKDPFYILDTDVIFYSNFEEYDFDAPLAGARIPEFRDEFSGCITRPRLHTSLLRFNPQLIADGVDAYLGKLCRSPFTPLADIINPLIVPLKGKPYFYDTCSMLYNIVGGEPFTDAHKNAYCHLHFGTISDIVMPRLNDKDRRSIEMARNSIMLDRSFGKGQWRHQEDYYLRHSV